MRLLLILLLVLLAHPASSEDLSLCIDGWRKTEAGHHTEALALFNRCIETGDLTETSLAQAYRNMAIIYKSKLQMEDALAYLDRALSLRSKDPWNDYVNRGTIWVKLGNYDKAMKDYNQALLIQPDYGPAYYGRGEIFEIRGETRKAIEEYKKAYDSGWTTQILYDKFVALGLIRESQHPE